MWRQLPVRELLPAVSIASVMRFWKLETKPLWGDELYTAFYSLGKNPFELPAGELLPLSDYWNLLAYPPDSSPWQAAYAVTAYSNHPPLFFMMMNGWLRWCGSSIWTLRALPALFGVLFVVGGYYLGCAVGGAKAGRYTALLMAVSPYGIYLSQEARHYSLAVAIATFSLTVWLQLLEEITSDDKNRCSKYHWIAWIVLNSLGLWVHYFYGFCIAAQWALTSAQFWQKRLAANRSIAIRKWLLAMSLTPVLCAPLWPTLLAHAQSGENISWLSRSLPWWQVVLLPWLQSIAASVFMLILLPIEESSLGVTVLSIIAMWAVFWLVLQQGVLGLLTAPRCCKRQLLVEYILCVFIAMLAITYETGNDLTVAPRYFLALYPAVAAVVACGLAHRQSQVLGIAIAARVLSQLFIIHDLALFKPYLPGQIGTSVAADGHPTIVLASPAPPQYSSRTLSYILAIPRRQNILVGITEPVPFEEGQIYLSEVEPFPYSSFRIWLVEVHRLDPFPTKLLLPSSTCTILGETLVTKRTQQQQYQCN